jgi:transcriptional regulator of arginine metabolism
MPIDTESMEKRRKAIVAILRSRRVARQAELVRLLKERGIRVTQSSVSRDLRQLGITKLDTGYQQLEQPDPETDRDAALLAEFVRDVRAAGGNLTVVKTAEGAAQRVALYLDRSGWPEIVGTVSGDDTIFVATRGGGDQRRLLARLRTLLAAGG